MPAPWPIRVIRLKSPLRSGKALIAISLGSRFLDPDHLEILPIFSCLIYPWS
jgi:hypothetical protein